MFRLDLLIFNFIKKLITDSQTQFFTLFVVFLIVRGICGGEQNDNRNNSK